ncbi:unnamed protein product [Merluccius merluccius]
MLTLPIDEPDMMCEPRFGANYPRETVPETLERDPSRRDGGSRHHSRREEMSSHSDLRQDPEEDEEEEDLSERGDEDEEDRDGEPDADGLARTRGGSRRKKLSKGRHERVKVRRQEANARERSRMHGLNAALESLRKVVPCYSKTQKLSKIETLRLAKNYIWALSETLSAGKRPDLLAFVQTLCKGLSQPTTNLVAGCLQLNARNFLTDHNGDVMFAGRPPYDAMYPYPGSDAGHPQVHGTSAAHVHGHHGHGHGTVDGAKPFRHYGSYGAAAAAAYADAAYYENASPPEAGSPGLHLDGGAPLSPPMNFNGIFSLKHNDEPSDYGKGGPAYGVRYCGVAGRGSVYRGSPEARFPFHDLHLRGQHYQPQQAEMHGSFHN